MAEIVNNTDLTLAQVNAELQDLYPTELDEDGDYVGGCPILELDDWRSSNNNQVIAFCRAVCDDQADNGSEACYQLDFDLCTLLFFDGDHQQELVIQPRRHGIEPYLWEWVGEFATREEAMAEWGYSNYLADLERVDEDYEGDCRIVVTRYYYSNDCQAQADSYLRHYGDLCVFDSASAAYALLAEIECGPTEENQDPTEGYNLSSGYARAELEVVKA
jgi:hypothetical protein